MDEEKDIWDELESGHSLESTETLPQTNINYNNQTRVFLQQIREKHKKNDLEKTSDGLLGNNPKKLKDSKKLKRSLTFCTLTGRQYVNSAVCLLLAKFLFTFYTALTGKKDRPKIDSTNLSSLITLDRKQDPLLRSLGTVF